MGNPGSRFASRELYRDYNPRHLSNAQRVTYDKNRNWNSRPVRKNDPDGATIPEIAAIGGMTVERVKRVIAGEEDITTGEHNRLLIAFQIYLWWNGYRLKQSWTVRPNEVRFIYLQARMYWDELCRQLRADLEAAFATING